ncbi:MAG TPA: ferrous iron transport protein A [Firmicutes bacterium]|jgi:ferrous iron transport protein A|nr:ferrous iron transport protein A [Bacillota bacterium]
MHYKPLHLLRPGTQGIVHHYLAGGCATKRLYEMGIYPGAKITVVKNDLGPVVLAFSGNKMALGRGLAQKIFVQI